ARGQDKHAGWGPRLRRESARSGERSLHLATTTGQHGGFAPMTVGARLPDFDLETSGGGRVTNSDLQGHRTVLYFYPKDDTPGCTIEGQEYTRLRAAFV